MENNEVGGACSTYGVEERCIQGLVGFRVGKRLLGRPRHRLEDNIKRIFKKWGEGFYWTVLVQDRDRWRALGNAIILRVP